MSTEQDSQKLRRKILDAVREFYQKEHGGDKNYQQGKRIPYAGRVFDETEMESLVDASLDFWLTAGRYAERFEQELARFLGVKYCSLVNSGSSANLLAFMALTVPELGKRQIRRGDEVITVACGFPTTVAPIIQYGAVPVLVDVTLPSYNIDCSQLEAALTDKTKAVMLAHTLGNPFDLQAVKQFCDRHELWLVEDNCDALGSRYCMGEGGAVYTNSAVLHRILQSLRDWGRDCCCPPGKDNLCGHRFDRQFGDLPPGYDHKYVYSHFGYNFKATDMQAAIGCAQLQKLPDFIAKRRRNWLLLREGLAGLDKYFILPEPADNSEPSWFGFLLTVRPEAPFSRDEMVQYLEQQGLQTRMLFAGNLTKHPCFDEMRQTGRGYRVVGELKNTDRVMRDTFWVGVYPGLSEKEIAIMIKAIRSFIEKQDGE